MSGITYNVHCPNCGHEDASGYTDAFSCKPRASEISGPIPVDLDNESHFLGIVSCVFSANA